MKIRKTTIALAVITAVTCVGGCGSRQTSEMGGGGEKLSFSLSRPDDGNQYVIQSSNINEDEWIKQFEEHFNVDIDLLYRDSKKDTEQLQMMFASGDVPDVIVAYGDCRTKLFAEAIENGAFMKLDDLIEENKEDLSLLLDTIPQRAWNESRTADGELYGIPIFFKEDGSSKATYIRKDLLDKYGLEIPDTIDDFVEVMRVFKENGMKYPYCAR